jgi:hypothetical protein
MEAEGGGQKGGRASVRERASVWEGRTESGKGR